MLTILAWITKQADLLFVVLAWIFVVLRMLHAYIHVTSNHLGSGAVHVRGERIVLAIMWAIFIVRILLSPDRHLKQFVSALFQEVTMSRFSRRQVIGGAGSALLVGSAGVARLRPIPRAT